MSATTHIGRSADDVAVDWVAASSLRWPNGDPLTLPFDGNPEGECTVYRGCDANNVYVASRHSPWLVGYRYDATADRLREFSRINLGFSAGGISSVAAGGAWVYATGAVADRFVVLKISNDWYQNRTRLLVTRIVDGGGRPESVTTSHEGHLVCVLYRAEGTIRVYHCRGDGRIDLVDQCPVEGSALRVHLDEHNRCLTIDHGRVGTSRVGLESIFEKIAEAATVRL